MYPVSVGQPLPLCDRAEQTEERPSGPSSSDREPRPDRRAEPPAPGPSSTDKHSMARIITGSLLLVVALLVPGCLQPPEFVGETVTASDSGASGGSLATTSGDDAGASTRTAPGSTTGLPSGAYGSACDLAGAPPILNYTAISPQPACDGGICLLVIDAKYQCEDNLQCQTNVDDASVCDGGICTVSPTVLLEDSRCTQPCQTVEDCPEIPGCMTGAICTSFLVSDELCCEKVCGCQDSLYLPGFMSLQMICDEMPEFCE